MEVTERPRGTAIIVKLGAKRTDDIVYKESENNEVGYVFGEISYS